MKYLAYSFIALAIIGLIACESAPSIRSTNQLYENLYDDVLRDDIKSIEYAGVTNVFFDCKGNLKQVDYQDGTVFRYLQQGDTIMNSINTKQRVLYILNTQGKIGQYISQLKDSLGNWSVLYQEDWKYNKEGKISEKLIHSKQGEKKNYFINQKVFNYTDKKLEIFKYGIDKARPEGKGLLRTETRLANDKGHWTSISEIDEDGIPYRKSSFRHEYDTKGNWTTIYLQEDNNYTGQSTKDTIIRKIHYYDNNECK